MFSSATEEKHRPQKVSLMLKPLNPAAWNFLVNNINKNNLSCEPSPFLIEKSVNLYNEKGLSLAILGFFPRRCSGLKIILFPLF